MTSTCSRWQPRETLMIDLQQLITGHIVVMATAVLAGQPARETLVELEATASEGNQNGAQPAIGTDPFAANAKLPSGIHITLPGGAETSQRNKPSAHLPISDGTKLPNPASTLLPTPRLSVAERLRR